MFGCWLTATVFSRLLPLYLSHLNLIELIDSSTAAAHAYEYTSTGACVLGLGLVYLPCHQTTMGYEETVVALRFNAVAIARDSVIQSALIQFRAETPDWTVPSNAEALEINIFAQRSASPASFSAVTNNLSGRPRTLRNVTWSSPRWTLSGEAFVDQLTVDIAPVLEEVVKLETWTSDSSFVILLQRRATVAVSPPRCHIARYSRADNTPFIIIEHLRLDLLLIVIM
jgi:hypothetical protein